MADNVQPQNIENAAELANLRRKRWRIAGIATGTVVGLLLLAGILIPYLYRDEIVHQVKMAINKNLNAKVDFSDVSLSLFRSFPNFNLRLSDLKVTGLREFKGVTLADVKALDLSIDFWSVWDGSPYQIEEITLKKPFLNIVVLPNGKANYDITKPSKAGESSSSDFKLYLEGYGISDGHLRYDDRSLGFFMEMKGLQHEGSGAMTSTVYDLNTETSIDSLTTSYGPMTYLSDAKATLDAVLKMDMNNMKFTLSDNKLAINDLKLDANGWFQMAKEGYKMDMKFNAPENEFKKFLSLIPGAYTSDFASVDAAGSLKFNGYVKGLYNEKSLPAFGVNLNIGNANFKYPDLPLGMTDIAADASIVSPSSNFNDMKIDINKLHLKLGSNPFDAVFHLRTPVSDPDIDTKVKGVIDLASLSKAFPMEGVKQLRGIINADVMAKTRMSFIDQKAYDKVNMSGRMLIKGMKTEMDGSPDVLINDMNMAFTPNNVQLASFDAKVGKSDIRANGTIDNILAYFSPDRTMTGDLTLRSNYFDADEWVSSDPGIENASPSTTPPAEGEKVFDRFNFTLDGQVNQIKYDTYRLTNTVAKGNFTPNKMTFEQMSTKIGNSDLQAKGVITNVFDYLFDNGILGGNLDLSSNLMDLNQFMTTSTTTSASSEPAAETGVLLVPDHMDIAVNTNMKTVKYTNLDLQNVTGKVQVKDEIASIQNGSANLLGGQLALAGGYDTQDKNKPSFDMKYEVKNFDFQRTFATFNTVQKLAPLAKFVEGKFNTSMVMSGDVGKDMMPDLNTLNITSFLHTINAVIRNFKPLEEVGNKLNLGQFKTLELKDTKNWIEVVNGMLEVKDFDFKVKDIVMKAGGKHGINTDMAYHIGAKVPRKMLEQGGVGAAASAGYSQLLGEAAKYGINIKNSEFVNVLFNITGSMASPKVGMKLTGADGQTVQDAATDAATAVVDKAKDTLRTRANQELEKGKEKAKEYTDKAVDTVSKVVNSEIEKAKQKAIEEAKKKVGDQIGTQAGKKVDDALNKAGLDEKAKKEADKLKDKIDNFNPFGGKKKNGGGG